MNNGKYAKIEIYWDGADWQNTGWAWRADKANGAETSGDIDTKGTLNDAVAETCHFLGVDLTPDDFACTTNDGGYAIYIDVGCRSTS